MAIAAVSESGEETARDARIREIVAQFPDGDLAYLHRRIAALEVENARMRAAVAVFLRSAWYEDVSRPDRVTCRGCGVQLWPMTFTHREECPVTLARAILASSIWEAAK